MFDSPPNSLQGYGTVMEPGDAAEPILSDAVRGALMDWLTEIWAKDALKDVGLQPRRKAMLSGPPGVGKTTLAHHLAARLGLRMLAVKPESLIDKYVGSSSRNIGGLFDVLKAQKAPVILFFDEFDAIAIKRREAKQGAEDERNNWVNTLLQKVEQYQGYMIAATNFADRIDPAIWRRFEMQIALEMPGQEERERILARYLAPFTLPEKELEAFAAGFENASPALMRSFCEGLRRQLAVGPIAKWDMNRERTIERLLACVKPHPDLDLPPLWNKGAEHPSIAKLSWPPQWPGA